MKNLFEEVFWRAVLLLLSIAIMYLITTISVQQWLWVVENGEPYFPMEKLMFSFRVVLVVYLGGSLAKCMRLLLEG